VLFWCVTILRYILVTIAAVFVSVFGAALLISKVISPNDDSPALGLLLFMLAVLFTCLLIPGGLGVTAELVERKVQTRQFRWVKALQRCLLAIPAMLGPAYAVLWILPMREDSRPAHWIPKLTALSCLSVAFAFRALRIKRGAMLPQQPTSE
jgi:hypothetical protein